MDLYKQNIIMNDIGANNIALYQVKNQFDQTDIIMFQGKSYKLVFNDYNLCMIKEDNQKGVILEGQLNGNYFNYKYSA